MNAKHATHAMFGMNAMNAMNARNARNAMIGPADMPSWSVHVIRIALVLAVACMSCMSGGCAAIATWPPVEGKAILAPAAPPCPQLMATALSFTRSNISPSAPLIFNLPPGTEWKVWSEVAGRLGPDARMMQPGDSPVFDVRQVRLDGGRAQVDVVYLTPDGVWQMATVHFTGAFGSNYRPTYFQHWLLPIDPPVCNTPSPPPPAPPPPPRGPAWPQAETAAGARVGAAAEA